MPLREKKASAKWKRPAVLNLDPRAEFWQQRIKKKKTLYHECLSVCHVAVGVTLRILEQALNGLKNYGTQ